MLLERLIQLSQKAREDAAHQMVQVFTEQLPVHALYRRSTCNVAFKYRTEDGQVRLSHHQSITSSHKVSASAKPVQVWLSLRFRHGNGSFE